MVVTAQEAVDLIDVRNRTGKLLVIGFNGSLSPQVRQAARYIKSGDAGQILSINAMVWEGWSHRYTGHWKQNREISGGGFMFDTGSHMLNTVSDLIGESFVEVTAWLNNRDKPIDIIGSVMARTASGILVTMIACGETIPSIGSDVHVFCTDATIRTGVWGERLEIQRRGETALTPVELPPSLGVWEQFIAVRGGKLENPSPPEIGLRMALLWDAIQASAAQGGNLIKIEPISTA
jgi:predicted dehydrogenase